MEGVYLYAVLAGSVDVDLGRSGLPDGITPIGAIPSGGLTALVSDYHGASFQDLTADEALRRLTIYERVLERSMAQGTPLPVRFGTVLPSREATVWLLTRFHDVLHEAFDEVRDAVEIDVSASWDVASVLKELSSESDVAAVLAAVGAANRGNDVAARLAVGQKAREILLERREVYRQRLVATIARHARDAEPHLRASDEVVMNVAYLVGRPELISFEQTVDRLGEEYGDRLQFRYVGPLPPYSFATVTVTQSDPQAIDAARRTLGLPERASRAELHDAYRRAAAESHPDRRPAGTADQERFRAVTAARDTLEDYMSREDAEPQPLDARYDLRPESVGEDLHLEVTRAQVNLDGTP